MKAISKMFLEFSFLRFCIGMSLSLLVNVNVVFCQQKTKDMGFTSKDSLYNANIQKSKLYGVYIPRDIQDAMTRLDALTDEKAREKLKKIDEKTMARKLFFGLGRWMEYNWNFQEGSRISHLLRKKGLSYTEDMTYTMLVLYHRHINGKDLGVDDLILQVVNDRKDKVEKDRANAVVVDSFQIKVPKN